MQSKIILPLNMARAHAAAISNGLLQRVPQLVQQPEQLGVFLFRQQIGHIVVRLVERVMENSRSMSRWNTCSSRCR